MADTETAAAAATNPAEVPKTQGADLKSETKTTSADVAGDSKSAGAGEETWKLNGDSKDREERRGGRNDRHDRNDRFNDRRGGGRGRGRGRGGFQNNRKCVEPCARVCTSQLLTQTGATRSSTTFPSLTTP